MIKAINILLKSFFANDFYNFFKEKAGYCNQTIGSVLEMIFSFKIILKVFKGYTYTFKDYTLYQRLLITKIKQFRMK